MGVAAALAPTTKPAPARAPAAARPRVQVRQTSHLLQRACDCGATAGLSGHCVSCDRVSLQSRSYGDQTHATPETPAVINDAARSNGLTHSSAASISSAPVLGHTLGHLGVGSLATVSRSRGSLSSGSPVRITSPVRLQTQLRVSSPGDLAEQEAEAMGKLVAHMAEPANQSSVSATPQAGAGAARHPTLPAVSIADGAVRIHRRAAGPLVATPEVLAHLRSTSSGGVPLPRDMLSFMEPRFGADFSAVRIHTDEHAAALSGQLSARAFTLGREIYFGKDQFRPSVAEGWELIAHELTHTIQQGSVPRLSAPPLNPAELAEPAIPAVVVEPVHRAELAHAVAPVHAAAATHPIVPAHVAAPVRADVPMHSAAPVHAIAPMRRAAPIHVDEPMHQPAPTRAAAPVHPAAPVHAAVPVHPVAPVHAVAPARVSAPAPVAAPVRVAERAPASIQRFGVSDALGYFADKANLIPGFRLLTIILGINPINMAPADRSAANILRALIELIPGGAIITQALQNNGVFDKVGAWVDDQVTALAGTGAALKQAVTNFLGTLSWSDILDLGGVWERAKRIFTEPIDRLFAFAKSVVTDILKFIKDAVLLPLAKLAEGTRGWDLLIVVLGKNPITGDKVAPTPEALIGGFLKLISQDEIWENMKKSNAIQRAWAWFQGAMSAVVAFVSQIPDLFIAAFKSLTIEDVVLVAGAFQKVASVFGGFLIKFTDWAGTAIWNLLEIIFDVVSPGALVYVKKTGAALKSILKDPLPFVHNLVAAAKLGLQNFADHFGTHLKEGLIDWLTGSLPGVYIPQALSLVELGKFALSVLGITWGQIRAKIVKALGASGETIMKALETGFDIVVALVKGGIGAAWDLIKEKLTNLKDMVVDGIVGFVTDTIISKAIPKLVSLFVPGAGFISAILSIYDTVKVFIDKLAKLVAVVKGFVDSIVAIAAGQISGAASRVETELTGVLSLAISFLAGFLQLGNISSKILGVVHKVQATVDKALDAAIGFLIGKAKAFIAKLFGKDKPDDRTDAQKQADLTKALAEAETVRETPNVTDSDVRKSLLSIKKKYNMTSLELMVDSSDDVKEIVHIAGKINPEGSTPKGPIPKQPGDTKTNPIEISWAKPSLADYKSITLAPPEEVATVGASSGGVPLATLQKLKGAFSVGPTGSHKLTSIQIGVASPYQITQNFTFQANPPSPRGGTVGGFNNELKAWGYNRNDNVAPPTDADHVLELQLGGPDDVSNIWPLNSSINRSSGNRVKSEKERVMNTFHPPLTDLKGKWLRLKL